ncbi:MAG TPA: phosphatidylglycerophosphatase A [Blastocatellia bacterium]|nr:phosphatidylglycerophosphatase A [Blastocatellia bacterium]
MTRPSPIKKESLTPSDRVAYALATGLGAGFTPIAPGTAGALEGVAIYLAIHALDLGQSTSLLVLAVINVILFAVGVWASNRTCEMTGLKDPRLIVIDEVSGQLISLTPLVLLRSFSITAVVIGFLLFRLFDIFKPYPIRKLERLRGGLGVMADDGLAGIYAAMLLWSSHLVGLA